jgi:hypothetical protein
MTNPHDNIRGQYHAGLFHIAPRVAGTGGEVIRNPLKAQRLAELMNSKKVAA